MVRGGGGEELLPAWALVGGDTRYVNINADGYHNKFLMHSTYELAVSPSHNLWVAATAGKYAPTGEVELRRHYILLNAHENVSVRWGRFFPAYGIMSPDHTLATRSGIGWRQDAETYNAEISVHGSIGELFVTTLFGGEEEVRLSKKRGYRIKGDETGTTIRGALFLGDTLQAGGSYWFGSTMEQDWLVAGAFAQWAPIPSLYGSIELDRRTVMSDPKRPHVDVSWTEVGYEVWRGVHLKASHEYYGGQRWRATLQLFPVTHVEILLRSEYAPSKTVSHTILLHTWL